MQISEIFSAPKAEPSKQQALLAPQTGGFKATFLQQWKSQAKESPLAPQSTTPLAKQPLKSTDKPLLATDLAQQSASSASESSSGNSSAIAPHQANPTPAETDPGQGLKANAQTKAQQTSELPTTQSEPAPVEAQQVSPVANPEPAPVDPNTLQQAETEQSDESTDQTDSQTPAMATPPPVLSWEDWYRIQNQELPLGKPETEIALNDSQNSPRAELETVATAQTQVLAEAELNGNEVTSQLKLEQALVNTQVIVKQAADSAQTEPQEAQPEQSLPAVFLQQVFGSQTSTATGETGKTGSSAPFQLTALQNLASLTPQLDAALASPVPSQAAQPQNNPAFNPLLLQNLASFKPPTQPLELSSPLTGDSSVLVGSQPILGYSSSGQAALELPETQSQANAQALAQRFELMQQLGERIQLLHASSRREIELQLKPAHLGKVTVLLQQEARHFNLQILTESPLTKQLIEAHLQQLKDQFNQQGFNLQHVQVDVQSQSQFNQEANPDSADSAPSKSQPIFELGETSETENDTHNESQSASAAVINTLA